MKRTRGFTLVELMVGLAIGMVLVLAAEHFLMTTLFANATGVKQQRFEQTLQALSGTMVSQIRRAGYARPAATLAMFGTKPYSVPGNDSDCIAFTHSTPTKDQVYFGFRLRNGAVHYFESMAAAPDCTNPSLTGWVAITDATLVNFGSVRFWANPAEPALINIALSAQGVDLTTPNGTPYSRTSNLAVRIRNM